MSGHGVRFVARPYGRRMLFSLRKTCNNAFEGDGCSHHSSSKYGGLSKSNCSRAFALMVVCCALNFGSIFAARGTDGSDFSELLDQGRKLLDEGKLAEAELVLDRAEKLAPSDSVILTLDARVKGRLGESSNAVALLKRVIRLTPGVRSGAR